MRVSGLEMAIATGLVALSFNVWKNRQASSVEFLSCWQPYEAQDMKAHPLVGSVADAMNGARDLEARIGPAVDACMAAKHLYITGESSAGCANSRLPLCYRRPWIDAALK